MKILHPKRTSIIIYRQLLFHHLQIIKKDHGYKSAGKKFYKNNKVKFLFNCHNCGLPGHKRADRKKIQKTKINESITAQIASDSQDSVFNFAATAEGKYQSCIELILDSGAMEHLVSNCDRLSNVVELENQ